jgi:hypothetical protein
MVLKTAWPWVRAWTTAAASGSVRVKKWELAMALPSVSQLATD